MPENWVQHPVVNTEAGSNPGAPLAWGSPENPDDAVAGYGYVAADTSEVEETFYYHSDHLGSTSYITDQKANVTQYDAYLPYGELLVDEHSSSADLPYKFNGKELDEETGLYYYGARYMNPITSMWYGVDPLAECYASTSSYIYCRSNPINLVDPNGMYDKKTAQSVAQKYGAEYHQDKKSGCWYVSLNESGTGAYESGGTLTRDFGMVDDFKVKGYSMSSFISAASIPITIKGDLTYCKQKMIPFGKTELRLWTSPVDNIIRTNMNGRGPVTGKKYRNMAEAKAKNIGRLGNVVNTAAIVCSEYEYYNQLKGPIGPNEREYLNSKRNVSRTMGLLGYSPYPIVQAFSMGYSLGGLIDTAIRIKTNNTKCFQINPYKTKLNCNLFDGFGLDFTPTENYIKELDNNYK